MPHSSPVAVRHASQGRQGLLAQRGDVGRRLAGWRTGGTRRITSTPRRARPGAGCGGAPSSNPGCGVHRHRRGARRPPCCEPRREASAACRIVIVQTFAQRESGRSIGEVASASFQALHLSQCRCWSMPEGESGRARRGRPVVTTVSRPIAHRRRSCPTAEGVDEGGVLRKAEQETQL